MQYGLGMAFLVSYFKQEVNLVKSLVGLKRPNVAYPLQDKM